MNTQILVPVDGTPVAEAVLPAVVPLARATGQSVVLLRVVPTPMQVAPLPGMTPPGADLADRIRAATAVAASYLAALSDRVREHGQPVETAVINGDPAAGILAYAAEHATIAMIAMATHARQGLNRWVFGSVAEAVLHAAHVPLLLVAYPQGHRAEPPEIAYRTILVPLDGSALAEEALSQARLLAAATGAGLELVAAVADPHDAGAAPGELTVSAEYERRAAVAKMAEYLQATGRRLQIAGLRAEAHLADGNPADAILRISDELGADLIVMTSHGRTGFEQLRLGSVALTVVRGSTRPVCLIRGRVAEKQPAAEQETWRGVLGAGTPAGSTAPLTASRSAARP